MTGGLVPAALLAWLALPATVQMAPVPPADQTGANQPTLLNLTGQAITRVEVSAPRDPPDWAEAPLPGPVPERERFRLEPPFAGCEILVRVTLADGATVAGRLRDACVAGEIRLGIAVPTSGASSRGVLHFFQIEAPSPWGVSPPGTGTGRQP